MSRSAPRWLLVLLGLVLIALLIWFVGPLISIAKWTPLGRVWVRIVVIALMFAGFGARIAWIKWRTARRNQAMMAELGNQPAPAAAAHETLAAEDISAMEQRAQKALAMMRDARVGKKGELVYELPWYVIIGPPGAGKTTALKNSGLDFPIAQALGDEPVRGIGGTRTTEWWFTDQAVLIDTAGRYTTQDSDEAVDSQVWRGLLDLLKRHRPRQPITGVIVAISVTELTGADESAAIAHGRAVRQRINEIHGAFGVRTPVYILLTKTDLLAGFTEFFDDLSSHEREQVWGETWPLAISEKGISSADLGKAFDGLVERLDERVLMRVQGEQDLARRGLIFAFPQQFASLRQPLEQMLATIVRETRFEPSPFVRGFYFTSGTQFGRPIDRLLGALSARFGMALSAGRAEAARGRSYFLRDLLATVVFPESALAGRDPKAERRERLIRLGVIGGAAAIAIVVALLWTFAYVRNAALIDRLATRSEALQKDVAALPQGPVSDSDVMQLLQPLDEARALPFASTAAPDDRTPGFSWGIGRAGATRAQVDGAYHNLLNRQFLPRLLLSLEDRLTSLAGDQPDAKDDTRPEIYRTLRLYLMLGRAPGAPLERDAILDWFDDRWAEALPGDDQTPAREALRRHLVSLLAGPIQPPRLDATLIGNARQRIATLGPGERVYAQMLGDPSLRNLPEFSLADVPGVGNSHLFTRKSGKPLTAGIPGMFRRRVFFTTILPTIGRYAAQSANESWVTGQPDAPSGPLTSQAGAVKDALLTTYLADFTRRWDDMIDDVVVSGDLPMDQRLRLAVLPPSPVKALFGAWADETNLTPPSISKGKAGAAARVGAVFSARIYRGMQRANQVGSAAHTDQPSAPGPLDEVIAHFEWLRALNPPSGPSPVDDALAALTAVGDTGTAARSAVGLGDPMLQKDKAASAMAATARLGQVASALPPAAGQLFNGFVNASTAQLNKQAAGNIKTLYAAQLMPECRSVVSQGFPMQAGAAHEIPIDDFSRLFRPDGLIDAFQTANLAGQIDTSHKNWALTQSGRALGLSPLVVAQFQKAGAIRDAFFKPGDIRPSVRFLIEPLAIGGDAAAVTLSVDGAPAAFDRVNRHGVELRWPGNAPGVTLSVQHNGSATPSVHNWSGDWGFFRFLHANSISQPSANGLVVVVADGGATARFRIRVLSGANPFLLPELTSFQCPAGL